MVQSGPAMLTGGAIGTLGRLIDEFPPAQREWPAFHMLRGFIGDSAFPTAGAKTQTSRTEER